MKQERAFSSQKLLDLFGGVYMSISNRVIYLLIGIIIFIASGWLTVIAASQTSANPNHTQFGIPTSIWIGILGSISASGIFFTISETLRWIFESTVSRNYKRLRFYEDTVGIKEFYSQKGSEKANKDYKRAIAAARHRVWAFGISNGEFISEHLAGLIDRKKRFPQLDICICFVDPQTNIKIKKKPPQ